MRLPGFTAEESVTKTTTRYQMRGEPSKTGANLVRPASACFDICIGYCGRSLVCADSCSDLCRGHRYAV